MEKESGFINLWDAYGRKKNLRNEERYEDDAEPETGQIMGERQNGWPNPLAQCTP